MLAPQRDKGFCLACTPVDTETKRDKHATELFNENWKHLEEQGGRGGCEHGSDIINKRHLEDQFVCTGIRGGPFPGGARRNLKGTRVLNDHPDKDSESGQSPSSTLESNAVYHVEDH